MNRLLLFILFLFLIPGQSLRGEGFHFALLSDLHITGDSLAANDLQHAVDQINATPKIQFVLVAGDITEQGDRASLQKAKTILDGLKPPYYITSGNHETKWSESGSTDFGHLFGSDRFRMEFGGYLFLGFNSGPVIRMAEGHVAPQDIQWLKDELQAAGSDQPVFLITHYPLLPADVDNWYSITQAVRPYNIKAFINGHYHADRMERYDDIPAFICRSTLRNKEDAGGYSLFHVTADSVVVYEQKIGVAPQRWGAYSLRERYFTADTMGYQRPDFSINTQYAQVKERWITSLDHAIYSSPVLYEDKVYVGDDLGWLSCLRVSDGKIMWRFATQNRIIGTPAADRGVLVFGSADGTIYGLDAKKGKLRWRVSTPAAVLGAVTIDGEVAYIGCSDHTFRALRLEDGSEVWTFNGLRGYVETRPLIYEDQVIFGAWDNNLYALDRHTGKPSWIWSDGRSGLHYSPAAVWPVAAHGRIFITAPDRVLSAIDAKTGKTIWRTDESTVRETIGLSEDHAQVYCKTMRDSVVCFATQGDQAVKRWAAYVGFGYELAPSMPQERAGVVFGSTMNGELYALQALDGTLLWRHKVLHSLINTVVPLSKTQCLFTSSAGLVGLLEVEDESDRGKPEI